MAKVGKIAFESSIKNMHNKEKLKRFFVRKNYTYDNKEKTRHNTYFKEYHKEMNKRSR